MIRIVRRDSLFAAIVKSAINLSAAYEKEHGASFLAAWMEVTVDGMLSVYIPTADSLQVYQGYICVLKFLLQWLNTFQIFEDFYGRKMRVKVLGISHLDDGTFFLSWK